VTKVKLHINISDKKIVTLSSSRKRSVLLCVYPNGTFLVKILLFVLRTKMIYTKFECLAMPLKVFVMDIEGSQIKGTA